MSLEYLVKHLQGRHQQKLHAPKSGKTAPQATPDEKSLKKFLRSKKDVLLYHVTGPESLVDIAKQGLVPGAQDAPAQYWKAEHSGYATYFHSDKGVALRDLDQAEGSVMITVRVPRTRENAKRILPDEDASPDPSDGLKILAEKGPVAVVGGIPADKIQSIAIPRESKEYMTADDIKELRATGVGLRFF